MTGVHVVISAHRPDDSLAAVVHSAVGQADRVVVVDDASGPGYEQLWARLSALGAGIVHLDDNQGIAVTLNSGLRSALHDGADFVLTLDQDSAIEQGFVAALRAEWARVTTMGQPVGFVVPEYFSSVRQTHRVVRGVRFARHAIQSGMLIPRGTLESVGLLREDLFIDLVDTEYELRCAARGLPSVAAPDLRLSHRLGARYERSTSGPRWWRQLRALILRDPVTLSTPFRYYYRVRNRRVISREYWKAEPMWILRDSIVEAAHYLTIPGLARPVPSLLRLYRVGWRDGARRGRMGRMSDDLAASAAGIAWSARQVED